uniref:Uncharacterized protein n=1 Tax=Rhodococcus hoagii TaxID=43767 RepID=A0A1Z1UX87_RHOHA|nr:hypothetical protein pVAPN1572_0481 [Prescottella equi]
MRGWKRVPAGGVGGTRMSIFCPEHPFGWRNSCARFGVSHHGTATTSTNPARRTAHENDPNPHGYIEATVVTSL